ncbi:MAG: sugar-binding transcriptional regulator [Aerococcus sp.]|nr:sugar-binding transcriptional regulator [Aerococcus sp.]
MSVSDHELIKIVSMYYEEGMTQAAIAKARGVSRSLIAKYLKDARERGIIEVVIKSESIYTTHLERQLEQQFHLKEAIVVDTSGLKTDDIKKRVSQQAALHLKHIIDDYQHIGISWGNTLRHMVDAFPYVNCPEAEVISLIGGLSDDYFDIQSNQLSYDLARKMRCKAKYLYAPALVSNQGILKELADNQAIQHVLEEGKHVDLALVGLSSLAQEQNMRRIGYIDDEAYRQLEMQGARGVINSRFYDVNGNELDNSINRSVLGMTLEDIQAIDNVMTVVYGDEKSEAVRIALSAGLVNTLVTTNTIAETIISN